MSGNGKGWANPGPAGLVALGVACFIFYAVLSGKVEHTCIPLLGIWLLGGFVVQLVVGLMELMEGAIVGGNVFTFFAAFFMLAGGLEMIFKYYASIHGWPMDTRIDGWAWLVLSFSLVLWTPAYLKSGPLSLIGIILALDVATVLVAFKDLAILTAPWAGPTIALFMLISGILGMYTAAGIILNTTFGRVVLPLGGPLIKDTSTSVGA